MNLIKRLARIAAIASVLVLPFISAPSASAADKAMLTQDAEAALQALYKHHDGAKAIGTQAAGILVFPRIVRAGFIVGGSGGEGVLFKKGKASGYYSSGSASVGLQAGIQSFGYAVFFVTEKELQKFQNSKGWDVGAAPTLVVVDSGAGKEINTTTAKDAVYAFVFNQEGLMAGMALQGQKISRVK